MVEALGTPCGELVRYAVVESHVALITMDRPEKHNAINSGMTIALDAAVSWAEGDEAVRVIILASSGRSFCAGADLAEVARGASAELRTERGGFAGLVDRCIGKPVIAAAAGPAVAGGFEIVLACDMIVASPAAYFALPEVKRGLIAGAGGVYRLPRALPPNIAREMILTGTELSAERAWQLGLVNHLVAADAVLSTALRLAVQIAANAPLAVEESLRVVRCVGAESEPELRAMAREASTRLAQSEDAREGARAFLERRPASWKRR